MGSDAIEGCRCWTAINPVDLDADYRVLASLSVEHSRDANTHAGSVSNTVSCAASSLGTTGSAHRHSVHEGIQSPNGGTEQEDLDGALRTSKVPGSRRCSAPTDAGRELMQVLASHAQRLVTYWFARAQPSLPFPRKPTAYHTTDIPGWAVGPGPLE